jgi:hypothetical protein
MSKLNSHNEGGIKLRNEVNSLWRSFKERQAKSREIIK